MNVIPTSNTMIVILHTQLMEFFTSQLIRQMSLYCIRLKTPADTFSGVHRTVVGSHAIVGDFHPVGSLHIFFQHVPALKHQIGVELVTVRMLRQPSLFEGRMTSRYMMAAKIFWLQ